MTHPENERRLQRAARNRPAAARRESRHWMSINEACGMLGVDQSTLRRWSDAGKVPVFRTPGGHRRYAEEDLITLLGEKGRRPAPFPAMHVGSDDDPADGPVGGSAGRMLSVGLRGPLPDHLPARATDYLRHIADVLSSVRAVGVDAAGLSRHAAMVRQAGVALGHLCAAHHHGAPEMVNALIALRPRIPYGTPADHIALAAVRQSETASHLLDQALISAVQAHSDATMATLPPPFTTTQDSPVLGDA